MSKNTIPPRCSSCGISWANHLGIAGTCADNVKLRDIIRRAQLKYRNGQQNGKTYVEVFAILQEIDQ